VTGPLGDLSGCHSPVQLGDTAAWRTGPRESRPTGPVLYPRVRDARQLTATLPSEQSAVVVRAVALQVIHQQGRQSWRHRHAAAVSGGAVLELSLSPPGHRSPTTACPSRAPTGPGPSSSTRPRRGRDWTVSRSPPPPAEAPSSNMHPKKATRRGPLRRACRTATRSALAWSGFTTTRRSTVRDDRGAVHRTEAIGCEASSPSSIDRVARGCGQVHSLDRGSRPRRPSAVQLRRDGVERRTDDGRLGDVRYRTTVVCDPVEKPPNAGRSTTCPGVGSVPGGGPPPCPAPCRESRAAGGLRAPRDGPAGLCRPRVDGRPGRRAPDSGLGRRGQLLSASA
jgi:hypothetical protein